MLHFDGLADVADGYWGSHDRARRLEIMSDSHIGAFGATAIALTIVVEVAALASILGSPHELPLLLVPAMARFSATAGCWLGTPARDGGLGRSVMARPTLLGALPALVVLVAVLAAWWVGFGAAGHCVRRARARGGTRDSARARADGSAGSPATCSARVCC